MSDTIGNTGVLLSEVENMIDKVQGVVSAKVVAEENGDITEIHVISDFTRSAKQVVRDIESVLIAQFNLRVDHKKISIAQVDLMGQRFCSDVRVRLESVQTVIARTNLSVTVRLGCHGEICEGSASGPISSSNSMRLGALATISAIQQMLENEHMVVLEDVAHVCLSRCEIVVVVVSWIRKESEEILVGAVPFGKSEIETVVNAVLSAVNRRISFYA
jgi:hypothetical protein